MPDGLEDALSRRRMLSGVGTAMIGSLTGGLKHTTETVVTDFSASSQSNGYAMSSGVHKIEADASRGFQMPYFLFTPSTPPVASESLNSSCKRPLIVEVTPWGDADNRIEYSSEAVRGGTGRTIAEATNSPLLVAPLNHEPPRIDSTGDPFLSDPSPPFTRDRRVDLQLTAMIENAKRRLNGSVFTVAERIRLIGASSAGRFADLFAAIHPEIVFALSSGANGIAFLPFHTVKTGTPTHQSEDETPLQQSTHSENRVQDAQLMATGDQGRIVRWPIGTAGLYNRAGETFDKSAWKEIDQYRWIGSEDQNSTNPQRNRHKLYSGDSPTGSLVRDLFGSLQVSDRFKTSKKIYNQLNVPATFVSFEGDGHVKSDESASKVADYHINGITQQVTVIHLTATVPQSNAQPGEPVSVVVTAINITESPATTQVEFGIENVVIETRQVTVPAGTSSSIEFEYAFINPGNYIPMINETELEGKQIIIESG